MEDLKGKLKRAGTLGGAIHVNPEMRRYYYGENEPGGPMSKEKLFGQHGPLLIGMPDSSSHKESITLEATVSDTREDLVRELVEQSKLTRREAEAVVTHMIASGQLAEIEHGDLGKVLVWGGQRQ